MARLTNNEDIPLQMAVWLAHDDYDYDDDPNTISATSLLKSTRQLVLGERARLQGATSLDVANLIPSSYGTAVHDAVEKAWLTGYRKALKRLGYSDSVIDRVKVNPKPEELAENDIPVYVEQRVHKKIGEYSISGKYDMVFQGAVNDIKTTSTYAFQSGNKDKDYIRQASIYRWLNPEIVTEDYIDIQFVFTDWSKLRATTEAGKGYPPKRIMPYRLSLMSLAETEQFISSRLAELETYHNSPESEIPYCSDEDLWVNVSVWKYYKNPKNTTRSTKNYDNPHEAYAHQSKDGNVGTVIEVKGQAKACLYCSAFEVCKQKDQLIAEGRLII